MIQKLKTLLTSFAILSLGIAPAAMPAVAYAAEGDIERNLCKGSSLNIDPEASGANCNDQAATTKVNNIIELIIDLFSLIVGVISVIMIIIGGLRYIISGGDSGNVTGAKNTILYAIIGLIVVALAQFIVKFVLDKVSTT